jgi:GntR family transcriptional regulator/MocR family aminotransferase
MRNYYRNQRDTLIACIKNNPASSFLQIREEDAGLHFLIQVHKDLSDKEIKQRTEQAGIRISCLSEYYYDKTMLTQMYPTLIMNYSGLQEENLEEAIHRLCQCLEQ